MSAERNDAAPVERPETPDDSPLTMEEAIALRRPLATAKLAIGDPAFAFELPLLDAAGDHPTGETVRLADHRGVRPVALIFGSYTWPPFRRQLGALEELHDRYSDEVAFLIVYIREAHPEDGWVLASNRREGVAVVDPATLDERAAAALACTARAPTRIPVALDGVDDEVASRYGGWPDRLYLVGRDGRIAYQGGEGPFGFLPEELEAAIERELAQAAP